jgi:hypothetical protein
MSVSVLVPWRTDNGQREKLWAYCEKVWQRSPYELVVGVEQGYGPFNISKAFNDAARKATGDIFVLYGADHLPDDDRIEWAVEQLKTYKWCALYSDTAGLSEVSTKQILKGADPAGIVPVQVAPVCTAIIAIRAEDWIDFDERFTGWGGEDTAWRMALESLYGPPPQPSGMLRCLYHNAAPRDHAQGNYNLIGEYITAEAEGRMSEYLKEIGIL